MSRPAGKTYARPIGNWPRVRAINISVGGYTAYPDVAAGEPLRASSSGIRGDQGENDAALRRAAHRELDRLLDQVLPKMPIQNGWVRWVEPGAGTLRDWQAHLIEWRRGVRIVKTACGVVRRTGISGQEAYFGLGDDFNHEIMCRDCAKIVAARRTA